MALKCRQNFEFNSSLDEPKRMDSIRIGWTYCIIQECKPTIHPSIHPSIYLSIYLLYTHTRYCTWYCTVQHQNDSIESMPVSAAHCRVNAHAYAYAYASSMHDH